MNKSELLFWKNKYDEEQERYTKGDEEELRKKFHDKKCVTKVDLIRIVHWKFQGRLLGRRKRILKLLADVEDSLVQDVSHLAFKYEDDEVRLKLFSIIKGIGNALSSVILTFYDPENYGVLDIHVWRGLFEKEPRDLFSNIRQAERFFLRLREISSQTGLSCRDIEKAYFTRELEATKKKGKGI